MSLDDLPVLVWPSQALVAVTILLVPPVCIVIFVLMIRGWWRTRPRCCGLTIFLATGIATIAVTCSPLFWKYALYALLGLVLATVLTALETAVRRLSNTWPLVTSAGLITLGYYLYLLSCVFIAGA